MTARLLLLLMLSFSLPAFAAVDKALEVTVKRVDSEDDGKVYQISASGAVQAAPAAVWKILTDYERMHEFVPDMRASRVLARVGGKVVVEQFGTAHVLFIKRDIHLIVQVTETPMSVIDIALVTGDMKVYHCRWELVPVPETGGTRIVYSGTLVPKFYVPGMLGANFIRSDIERMMAAVLTRLDRPE
jgi:ribosome-associated toxin RatA of RatAB toxin-antitoxin module